VITQPLLPPAVALVAVAVVILQVVVEAQAPVTKLAQTTQLRDSPIRS